MNKKILAAVSSAALVLGATSANAGIIIPAGEWTLDVNGNVNVYVTAQDYDDTAPAEGSLRLGGGKDARGEDKNYSINTGLLPAWLGFTGTTRQNDLDVSFTISMQPNVSDSSTAGDSKTPLFRQAFLTFGDASWGTVKMGKDLGIFAGQAILADMTLLGVGGGYGASGEVTTLGGIGTGYIYPAWKGQVAYTTPNMNGLQVTVGVTNPNQGIDTPKYIYQDRLGFEAGVTYALENGKIWASGASYEVQDSTYSWDATAGDIGATLNFGNLGITAYAYLTDGVGTTFFGNGGALNGSEREGQGGYGQVTYVIPSGTKLGVAYGLSELDATANGDVENERWTVGAYHPMTKHLNLVAEVNMMEGSDDTGTAESKAFSLGAILFF
ncbi:MAG: porin [Methylophilaceae bacterium]|nr:porin [Methylophilaceae bacterium]